MNHLLVYSSAGTIPLVISVIIGVASALWIALALLGVFSKGEGWE